MGELSYKPLIEEMVWSYSRLSSFDSCPYRWFLKYIKHDKENEQFYASYGSFMHRLIEGYYKGKISKEDMLTTFLKNFSKEVRGARPHEKTVEKYIRYGSEYLKAFRPFKFKMIDVEKKVKFHINGIPFVGYIDYLGMDEDKFVIVDNKSRDLKKRSTRLKPTAKDKELDQMLGQLYLYSAAIKQLYGEFPKLLCFNCFKTNTFIEEPFDEDIYNDTIKWAIKKIEEIKNADDFHPNIDYFFCNYICGFSNTCCYNQNRKGGVR